MLRLVIYFLIVGGFAAILSWLADNPGSIVINWRGYIWDTNVFQMAIILSVLGALTVVAWTILRGIWQSPAAIGNFFNRRREQRGLEALSSGMIAIGAGDRSLATRYAVQARKSLPNEPMTHLLRAQAAQLSGDRTTSRRIFEAMLGSPDTEALGLRGLFLEAEREGEQEAARQFAERAVKLNPKLSWPVDALFDIQCRASDWNGALETLAIAKKHGHIEKPLADRRRAVLLAGQAQDAEDNDPERAMNLALEAHNLAPDLVPAAAVAGRLLAARGNTPRATKVVQRTWRKAQHPDLAVAYAYARLGDSPRDRLKRVRELAALTPNVVESPIAIANAAIEAHDFEAARKALEPLTEGRLSQRVCTLMARIEGEQRGNAGGVREWLARAVNAPRDPAWTADGIVSDTWLPVSPATGALDAFQWRVPVEAAQPRDKELLAEKIEELVKLGVHPETMLSAAGGNDDVAANISPDDAVAAKKSSSDGNGVGDVDGSVTTVDVEAVEISPSPASSSKTSVTEAKEKSEDAERKPADTATTSVPVSSRKPSQDAAETPTEAAIATGEDNAKPKEQAAARTTTLRSDEVTEKDAVATAERSESGNVDAPASPPAAAPKQDDAKHSSATETPVAPPAKTTQNKPAPEKPSSTEPQIFVSPPAPDDPGPEPSDPSSGPVRSRDPILRFQTSKG